MFFLGCTFDGGRTHTLDSSAVRVAVWLHPSVDHVACLIPSFFPHCLDLPICHVVLKNSIAVHKRLVVSDGECCARYVHAAFFEFYPVIGFG